MNQKDEYLVIQNSLYIYIIVYIENKIILKQINHKINS